MKVAYENLSKVNEPFFEELEKAFSKALRSGWYVLGGEVQKFERNFAKYNSTPYCVGVASGLDALTLSLKACDFPKNSEIIVPSNTYIATILAILNADLIPVMVEPNENTYNINPKEISKKITERTRGIMVVHLYGKTCEMDKVMSIAESKNLTVFEDCAQSHGSKYKNKLSGTFGDFGCFSFYPTKNLGAIGDAGAVICKSEEHYNKLKALRNYGSHVKYHNRYLGMNSRLDEVQASLLNVKLKYIDKITEHKRSLAKIYLSNIKNDKVVLPNIDEQFFDVFHIFCIRTQERENLREYLLKNGISTEIHYPVPPHKQECMVGILKGEFPSSEKLHKEILSLPISYANTREEIEYVSQVVNEF